MTLHIAKAYQITTPSADAASEFASSYDANSTNGTLPVVYDIPRIIISSALLLIIIMAVIFGNILVLLAVLMERKLRTVTNYFIFNLAFADLLLGTLVLPFSGTLEVINYWPFGQSFCDVWAAVDVLCCTASIISLCVISIDRYIGVTRPLKHKLIVTPRRALLIIVGVWLLSFAIAVGPLFGWRPSKHDPLDCPLSDSIDYVFFSVSGSFYIPLIVIVVLYVRIYQTVSGEYKSRRIDKAYGTPSPSSEKGSPNGVVLRMHRGSVHQPAGHQLVRRQNSSNNMLKHSRSSSQRSANFNREKKVAKTLGIVVSVFFLCWFPFFFILPLTSACTSCYVPPLAFDVFFWLGYCNSFMNPLIYAVSNMTFRRAFKKILSCQYCDDCPCGSTRAQIKVYHGNARLRNPRDSMQYSAVSGGSDGDTRACEEELNACQVALAGRSGASSGADCRLLDPCETQELLPKSPLRRVVSDANKTDCKVLYARLSMGGDPSLSTITEVQEHPESGEASFQDRGLRIYHFSSSSEDISACSSPSHSSQRNHDVYSVDDDAHRTNRSGTLTTNAIINQSVNGCKDTVNTTENDELPEADRNDNKIVQLETKTTLIPQPAVTSRRKLKVPTVSMETSL